MGLYFRLWQSFTEKSSTCALNRRRVVPEPRANINSVVQPPVVVAHAHLESVGLAHLLITSHSIQHVVRSEQLYDKSQTGFLRPKRCGPLDIFLESLAGYLQISVELPRDGPADLA